MDASDRPNTDPLDVLAAQVLRQAMLAARWCIARDDYEGTAKMAAAAKAFQAIYDAQRPTATAGHDVTVPQELVDRAIARAAAAGMDVEALERWANGERA